MRRISPAIGPIGRDRELAQLTERRGTRRLVTLIGPGGIGKTTLARAPARRVRRTAALSR